MSDLKFIGQNMRRKDGPDKVSGKAVYSQDVKLPGMLIGRVLRSPHPHARILRIDTSKAKALPGVKAVITHEDTIGVIDGRTLGKPHSPDEARGTHRMFPRAAMKRVPIPSPIVCFVFPALFLRKTNINCSRYSFHTVSGFT